MQNLTIIILLLLVNTFSFAVVNVDKKQDRLQLARALILDKIDSNQGTIAYIGGDGACDGSDLQTAIDDAFNLGFGEIRLANNTTYSHVNINSVGLNIIGGFDSCTDAINNSVGTGKAILNGINSQAVMNINNATVNIENLILQNGARGLKVSSNSPVNVRNSVIRDNSGFTFGGGLSAENSESVFLQDVRIHNNSAEIQGAGIYSTQSKVYIVGESSIDNNILTDNNLSSAGAGIFGIGSEITMVGGSNTTPNFGISLNRSVRSGGGIFMTNQGASSFVPKLVLTGAELEIDGITYGDLTKPLVLFDNRAGFNGSSGSGGGIYLTSGTHSEITNVSITDNKARVNGAGVVVDGANTQLNVRRSQRPCWSDNGCNYFGLNRAANVGGALIVSNGATANINASKFTGNWANEATVAFVGGSGSELLMSSGFIHNNGREGAQGLDDNAVFKLNNLATMTISQMTIVDNLSTNTVFNVLSSELTITNSFIYNPAVGPYISSTSGNNITTDCLLVDQANNSSLGNAVAINNFDYSNAFINSSNGDYHLTEYSVANDQCLSSSSNITGDIDNEEFGFDDPRITNINGSYDIGADENRSHDYIFSNGFEDEKD